MPMLEHKGVVKPLLAQDPNVADLYADVILVHRLSVYFRRRPRSISPPTTVLSWDHIHHQFTL